MQVSRSFLHLRGPSNQFLSNSFRHQTIQKQMETKTKTMVEQAGVPLK